MHGKKVRLRERIFDLEDFRKVVNSTVGALQGKDGLVFETPGGVHAHRDAFSVVLALGHGLHIFKVTDCPGQKLHERSALVPYIIAEG